MSELPEELAWPRLEALRERFLRGSALGDYWQDEADLAAYDAVFAPRIGWKWDAVLEELAERDIDLDGRVVLDYGCGSGIASRRFVAHFGAGARQLLLHDRSSLAMQFATERARAAGLDAHECKEPPDTIDVLLISHVLGELTDAGQARLLQVVRRATTVVWVEPGSSEVSRKLSAVRDRLRDEFSILAPCTHAQPCGALANEQDWCHFFATPAPEVFTDANWNRVGRTLGIDLRSLPYSFVALSKAQPSTPSTASRVLGRPDVRAKLARVITCDADGLAPLTVYKKQDAALFKQLKKNAASVRLV